jgi:hypothetical protein
MSKTIRTKAPARGDFVVGHKAVAFHSGGLPCVRGRIVAVDDNGRSVEFEVNNLLLAAFGFPKRTRWTWRRSIKAYQHEHSRTRRGEGLALVVGARSRP